MNVERTQTQKPSVLSLLMEIAQSQKSIAESLAAMAAAANPDKPTRTRGSDDHRAAMAAVLAGATTFAEISRETGIPRSTLQGWPKIADALRAVRGETRGGYRNADGSVDGVYYDAEFDG